MFIKGNPLAKSLNIATFYRTWIPNIGTGIGPKN